MRGPGIAKLERGAGLMKLWSGVGRKAWLKKSVLGLQSDLLH